MDKYARDCDFTFIPFDLPNNNFLSKEHRNNDNVYPDALLEKNELGYNINFCFFSFQ